LNLAVRIKELRKSKGVTQEEVYNATGVHIARVEQGKRDVPILPYGSYPRIFR